MRTKTRPEAPPNHRLIVSIAGSILSGLLLAGSFPGFGESELAFIGLVPLMYVAWHATPKRAAALGLLTGFVFFMLSLAWLTNLTGTVAGIAFKASAILGSATLALYCALYVIPFAVLVSVCGRRWGFGAFRSNVRLMFAVTMVWVASEYLRSILFTGFPWNALGVSQYASPIIIQIAELGGVYIVSAVIVWMNAGLFITLLQYIRGLRLSKYRPHGELMVGLLPLVLSSAYGLRAVLNPPIPEPLIRVALIQPNVPQTEKWNREKDQQVRDTLETLTTAASRSDHTDLIIWPETALPDTFSSCDRCRSLVSRLTAAGIPLLVGAIEREQTASGSSYFNSSVLIGADDVEIAQYNKQHLVPFGEYVPFPGLLKKFTPVQVDLSRGTESTLLAFDDHPPFSVLICFEDTVAGLSAKAVRAGAQWLVNQTNDAWFDPGAQSEQHLAHAVFRCVENRVPMARCGNTGTTCIIDSFGNVDRTLAPMTRGFTVSTIRPRSEKQSQTFYTQHGDAFARFALFASAVVIVVLRWRAKPRQNGAV